MPAIPVSAFKRNLSAARRRVSNVKRSTAREMEASGLRPRGVVDLMSKIKAIDFAVYGSCLFLALFKDFVLDYVGLGSVPVIGTIVTLLVAASMAFVMLFDTHASSSKALARKITVFIIGNCIEAFAFGFNFLPIETITICVLYVIVLSSRTE